MLQATKAHQLLQEQIQLLDQQLLQCLMLVRILLIATQIDIMRLVKEHNILDGQDPLVKQQLLDRALRPGQLHLQALLLLQTQQRQLISLMLAV